MALEQQDQSITAQFAYGENNNQSSPVCMSLETEENSKNGSMYVSFFHIPHMSSAVEAHRVRQALLPFAELLREHHIDLDVRHLTLYHGTQIDQVILALQRLRLGAELQQTLTHYEPIELAISQQQEDTCPIPLLESHTNSQSNTLQHFLYTVLNKLKQWIKALQTNKDN